MAYSTVDEMVRDLYNREKQGTTTGGTRQPTADELARDLYNTTTGKTTRPTTGGTTSPTTQNNMDEEALRRAWVQQTGADYDTLFGGGGNTQTTTGGTTGGNTNIPADFGWGNNLPGTNIPSFGGNTTPAQTVPTVIGGNTADPLSELGWGDNLPGTTVPTATQPTVPSQQQPSGLTTTDYINYYTSRGYAKAPISYESWVDMMQSGGGNTTPTQTTPTNPTNPGTGGTTQQGDLQAEYSALMNKYANGTITLEEAQRLEYLQGYLYGGGNTTPTNPGGQTGGQQPSSGEQGTQPTQQDLQAEWSTLMQKYANGTITIQEALRLKELQDYLYGNGANPGAGIGGGSGIGGGNGIGGGSMIHELPPIAYDRTQMIRDMYDAQINAERAALQEQGEQALSDAQANRDKIADTYNRQRNAASVDWERQRRNFLEGAMTSGLNTGAGSQAELSMMSMYQRNQNELGAAQAGAEAEADRNIADIKRSTQAAINEAVMKNDYQKAAALLDEYKDAYNREMDRAEALASFGDFSGYANIYGEAAARQMASNWAMQNPEVALAMGLITQQQYAALTLYKQYPALAVANTVGGYSGSSGGSGGGDAGGGGGSNNDYATMIRDANLAVDWLNDKIINYYGGGNG